MDKERVYVLTDRGTVGDTRWIVAEIRDAEDHSCFGVLIHKHIYYKIWTNTITYKMETSGDFPLTEVELNVMKRLFFDTEEEWRKGPGTQIGPPKAFKYKVEW